MYDVICYGTICQDRIVRIPQYPDLGRSVWIQDDQICMGGEAVNSTIAFNAWGLRTLLLGTILGRDERASWLLEQFESLPNVDCSLLTASHNADTPYCLILATPDAERTMFGRHFNTMRGQEVSELPDARVFTLDPYCGEASVKAAQAARDGGMKIVAMDAIGNDEIADCADIIVTSYLEIAPGLPIEKSEEAARETAQRVRRTVVVTLGGSGSVAFNASGEIIHRQPAVKVPAEMVQDATGCGDIFRAGLTCGIAQDWPLEKSMAFASAAAALNLLGMGGGGHVLSLNETLAIAVKGSLS